MLDSQVTVIFNRHTIVPPSCKHAKNQSALNCPPLLCAQFWITKPKKTFCKPQAEIWASSHSLIWLNCFFFFFFCLRTSRHRWVTSRAFVLAPGNHHHIQLISFLAILAVKMLEPRDVASEVCMPKIKLQARTQDLWFDSSGHRVSYVPTLFTLSLLQLLSTTPNPRREGEQARSFCQGEQGPLRNRSFSSRCPWA